jgi:hypothetical protein
MRGRLVFLSLLFLISAGAGATALPPIIADADNTVPKCVTPAALMQFVAERNARHQPPPKIASRFEGIASRYQSVGQCVARPPQNCVGVRWDYAFFQMLIETNYLTFLRPGGTPASVTADDIILRVSALQFPANRASVSRMSIQACSRTFSMF